MRVYQNIQEKIKSGKKLLAVLIDPDKSENEEGLKRFLEDCHSAQVDYFFAGGSLLTQGSLNQIIPFIKKNSSIPVILFPGDVIQVHPEADAVLFLSLISGRNSELLIGKHVVAAPLIRKMNLETISTGYMLIDCGNATTASYISQTLPIPYSKNEIAAVTAIAGEMLGMQMIYADGGSGAAKPVSEKMIREIKNNISVPLITGGGIKNLSDAENAWKNGADLVVIGTAFENNPGLISTFKSRR